ncbi:MAG: hypothetical protein WAP37_08340 [Solirubrobacterales bacterium]
MVEILLAIAAVSIAVVAIALPLLRGVDETRVDGRRDELETAKQAKYREIRDAELDYRAGKLTERQWRDTDADLRREALVILGEMDGGAGPATAEAASPDAENIH